MLLQVRADVEQQVSAALHQAAEADHRVSVVQQECVSAIAAAKAAEAAATAQAAAAQAAQAEALRLQHMAEATQLRYCLLLCAVVHKCHLPAHSKWIESNDVLQVCRLQELHTTAVEGQEKDMRRLCEATAQCEALKSAIADLKDQNNRQKASRQDRGCCARTCGKLA